MRPALIHGAKQATFALIIAVESQASARCGPWAGLLSFVMTSHMREQPSATLGRWASSGDACLHSARRFTISSTPSGCLPSTEYRFFGCASAALLRKPLSQLVAGLSDFVRDPGRRKGVHRVRKQGSPTGGSDNALGFAMF